MQSDDTSSNSREQELREYIAQIEDPNTGLNLSTGDTITSLAIGRDVLELHLQPGYPIKYMGQQLEAVIRQKIKMLAPELTVTIKLKQLIPALAVSGATQPIANVKNIIAVASGKGGVGKSTTSINLALALVEEGARVGLLDADIYGPSQPLMLGVADSVKPDIIDNKIFMPVVVNKLETMSMGYLVTEKTPMVWRGPMASGALLQMINQTQWSELDYLIIDLPPGTGDIQLTLAQQLPCSGSVIVTTPQHVALLDARKGVEMFKKVNIPCFGIVENMATHICSQCGHNEAIFGSGGGEKIAEMYGVPLLGQLPLDAKLCEALDKGESPLINDPHSAISQSYLNIARSLAAEICKKALCSEEQIPEIVMSDD